MTAPIVMGLSHLMLSFAAAVFFLIITPGPGVMSAAGVAAAYGRPAGLRYVFGLFLGNATVILAVATGLAALVLTVPWLRSLLFAASILYLCYLALKIALSHQNLAFIRADQKPGVLAGFLLQPINPKAYAVNTALFSGFPLVASSYTIEVFWKFIILNAIWYPIHILWVWLGAALQHLDLTPAASRRINIAMAVSMLLVVAIAALASAP